MTTKLVPGVPLCDVQGQYRAIERPILEAISRVLASGQVILGPEVKAFEEEAAAYLGAGHAVACGSGTDAILLALLALDIGPGDEVIIPPFTFFATAGCVSRLGARPVFADIDPATYNLDPLQVENKITERTRAIIPVHLYGQCADMEPLWQIAERHRLPIIEDAAQAIGAEYQKKRAGTLGSIAAFSFYPSKNLGAYGDAGMVVTSDYEWAKKMARLRVHGMEPKYYHQYVGICSRMDAVQAAILRVKLTFLEDWIARRQRAAQRYDSLIIDHHLGHVMEKPAVRSNRRHVFHQYMVRVSGGLRDELIAHLQKEHIGTDIYYPVPLHLQECFRHLGHARGDFPASEQAADSVLALPIYPEIEATQQERVIQACADFVRRRAKVAA
jgi:dTDP-4-amino-4,6-dideoxygalactose transaminase